MGTWVGAWRVDRPLPADAAGGQVQRHEAVLEALEGDRVHHAGRRVDHRGAGDPRNLDVPARQVASRHRLAQMCPPRPVAGARIERVDRVVLGRDDHPAARHERLGIDGAIHPRRPQATHAAKRRPGRGDSGARGLAVIHRPVAA
jgi:hypothetical protein